MTKRQKTPIYMASGLLLLLTVVGVFGPVYGQLQQSGGAGSSVVASQSGVWNVNNISGTISLPTGAATAAKQPALGTAGSAAADVISVQGVAGMTALAVAPKTSCGGAAFTPAWQTVPTAATSLTSTTSCVVAILITNTNASPQTVTVTDGQTAPVAVLSAFSIPGNSQVTLPLHGAQMTSGIKWLAGGAGVTGTVVAYQ